MSKLKILTYPHPLLAKKALPFSNVNKALFSLADDMLETMYDAPGIGLAANQVGLLKRMLVIDIEYSHVEDALSEKKEEGMLPQKIQHQKPVIMINPRITYKEGHQVFHEGCLSVPTFYHDVIRAQRISVHYQTIDGHTQKLDAEDLLAVVIQHEIDHLDGKLFIDRVGLKNTRDIRQTLKKKGL